MLLLLDSRRLSTRNEGSHCIPVSTMSFTFAIGVTLLIAVLQTEGMLSVPLCVVGEYQNVIPYDECNFADAVLQTEGMLSVPLCVVGGRCCNWGYSTVDCDDH